MERVAGIEPASRPWKGRIISHYTIPACRVGFYTKQRGRMIPNFIKNDNPRRNARDAVESRHVNIGPWRSWLARLLWEQEAAGSSPAGPTMTKTPRIRGVFVYLKKEYGFPWFNIFATLIY